MHSRLMLPGHWHMPFVYFSISKFLDYRFLEDVARTADHISRDTLLKRPLSNKHVSISSKPFWLEFFLID